MFGPITDRERIGWQLRAARVLTDLLKTAFAEGLPPVSWSIGTTGNLVAHCYHATTAERRAAWEAWRAVLDATAWPERTDGSGVVHLHAVADRFNGVRAAVLADLLPDDDITPEATP